MVRIQIDNPQIPGASLVDCQVRKTDRGKIRKTICGEFPRRDGILPETGGRKTPAVGKIEWGRTNTRAE